MSAVLMSATLTPEAEDPPVSSEVYVSVLSAELDRACVDARLPLPEDAKPAIGFEGDRLLVLDQALTDDLDVAPYLLRIDVDASECAWTPIIQRR